MKNKFIIYEGDNPKMNERTILNQGIESGCIPKNKFVESGFGYYPKGVFMWYGKTKKGSTFVFYSDGKVVHWDTGNSKYWYNDANPCKGLEQTVGKSPDLTSFNPDQQKYIDDIVSKEGVQIEKPSDYETERNKWEVIDLNTRNNVLFPVKGKYIVYKQKGEINATKPQQENIIKSLERQGFVRDEPPANESEKYIKVNLQVIENRKYLQYFKDAPFYMWQPVEDVDISSLLQDVKNKFDNQKVDRKQCRQVIDILYTALVNNYKLEDGERIAYKEYAQKCDNQKTFTFRTGKKLEKLKSLNPRHKSKLSLNMKNENKNYLKSVIHENLIEMSNQKKRLITEETKIIDTRYKLLIENSNFKTRKGRVKFCDDLLYEIVYLRSQNFDNTLINEQAGGIFDFVKKLFGSSGEAIIQMFKQRAIEWVMDTFLPEGYNSKSILGSIFVSALSNTPIGDIPKLTECGYLTKALSKAIVEEIPKYLQRKQGLEGGAYDVLRNALLETLGKSDWGQKIEESLGNLICPSLKGVRERMSAAGDTLKSAITQPTPTLATN